MASRALNGRDPKVKALLQELPEVAARFCQAADMIYQKIFIGQFQDYEERYGTGLLAKINDARKAALIGAIKRYMLYTFFRYVEAESSTPELPAVITRRLQRDMEDKAGAGSTPAPSSLFWERVRVRALCNRIKDRIYHGSRKGPHIPSFMDYVNYQNPHFEDTRMAPPFRFGNDIGEIMQQFDRPFSFMASQQGLMISKITETLLQGADEHPATERSEATAPVGRCSSGVPVGTGVLVSTFGWWFAWGVFSSIMVLIVAKGGNLSLGAILFVVLGVGVLSGTTALFCYTRKRLKG